MKKCFVIIMEIIQKAGFILAGLPGSHPEMRPVPVHAKRVIVLQPFESGTRKE
jgi:hypothetical protein